MTLRPFDELLKAGVIKRQAPNKPRSSSLAAEADEKRRFLFVSIKNIPPEQMSPNFVTEACYDIIMELLRARMFLDGYNAGNSHEAEVSYMARLGFSQGQMRAMDDLRYYRNGIKYYGTMLDKEYADKTLAFMEQMHQTLRKLLPGSRD